MSEHASLSLKNAYKILAVVFLAATSPGLAIDSTAGCAAAAALEPNGLVRGWADAEAELFRLDLPSAGLVTLDVMTPRVEENPVKLELSSNVCAGGNPGKGTVVERSAGHLVLAMRGPGTLWLRAATRVPGRYKLFTSFVEARLHEETFAVEASRGDRRLSVRQTSFLAPSSLAPPQTAIAGALVKNDQETVDPDPNTVTAPSRLLVGLVRLNDAAEKNEQETVDPDPNTNPLTSGPGESRLRRDYLFHYEGVCGPAGKDDDHGDTPTCATPLWIDQAGRAPVRITGDIGNGWGDDVDLFLLTPSEVMSVEVTVRSDAGASAVLYNRSGQQLAAGARTITLEPDRYYVRIEGAEGAYELIVTARSW